MLMKMRSKMQNQKGFTLVELMVVVVILGILVAIAVPVYNSTQLKAKVNAHNANVRTIESAATMYIVDNPGVAVDINATAAATPAPGVMATYLQSWPSNPLPAGHAKAGNYGLEITAAGAITVTPGKV